MKKAATILSMCALMISMSGCRNGYDLSYEFGEETRVVCWSGGKIFYDDVSVGLVEVRYGSIRYKSKNTGQYIRTTADCVITKNFDK